MFADPQLKEILAHKRELIEESANIRADLQSQLGSITPMTAAAESGVRIARQFMSVCDLFVTER